ncbi:hypothetical protein [Enterobacter sp. DE0047]|uniref:hypothetical protein n=1 Tax=Enterobacter sp. DE0047 TaxID=2584949 RepID=UPI001643CB16|nr:hypothetical protein [Enterobacter sp. DE0047]
MNDVKIYTVMSDDLSPPIKGEGFCTDMVRFSNYAALEAERAALAAENVALNNFIAASCYVYAGELGYWPAIDHSPEIPATNQLSIAESQFLTDVMTAAGLLSCGKRDKQLAQRLSGFCVSKRGGSNPAKIRAGEAV